MLETGRHFYGEKTMYERNRNEQGEWMLSAAWAPGQEQSGHRSKVRLGPGEGAP